MKNTQKTANKLPMPGKVRKGFRFYCVAENYLDHYYPIRYLIRFNGIRLPEAPR